jgi:HlyD family secretion protein
MKPATAISLFLCVLTGPLAQASDTTRPEPGRRQVSAQGRIEPEGGVMKVAAPYAFSAPQIVTELHVKTGDAVTKGQVLATLDSNARLQAALTTAQAQVKLAESRHTLALTRMRAGEIESAAAAAASAQIDFEHAERELKRSTQLDSQAAVAQMDIDRWQTEVNAKRKLVEKMQHAHAALRDTLAAEANAAEAAVAAAQTEARRAEAETAYGKVLAPRDSRVLKTLLHAGELAASPVLELGDTRVMNVIAEVYETDARFVKVGTQACITSQALATPLTGKVISIGLRVRKRDAFNVDPAARTDGRVVEVKIRLDDATAVAGLTNLEVDVVIGGERNDE